MRTILPILLFLLSGLFLHGAEKLEIRTFPDGYRDDRTGSVFSDAPSVLILHTWAKEKAFRSGRVAVTLELPENFRIGHYSIGRRPRPGKSISSAPAGKGWRKWTLSAGNVNYQSVYRVSAHPWRPTVPWTESSVVIFLSPEGRGPERFDVPWTVTGDAFEPVSGTMKLFTLPAPVLTKKPKHLSVWSAMGMYGNKTGPGAWTEEYYLAILKTMRNAGVNGIVESGGSWLPDAVCPVAELRSGLGFETIAMNCFSYSQRITPEAMNAAGFRVTDRDVKRNASGRSMREMRNCPKQMFCFSAMAEKDSPVRACMRSYYRRYIRRGFRVFFSDYEPPVYDCCYCDKCRRAFAAFAGADESECLKLKAGELVARYPWKWYLFRCNLFGKVLKLLREELGVTIGWNSNLVHENVYLSALRSFGWSAFAEDPRILDGSVDFHSADSLATGLASVMTVGAFLQKTPDGKALLSRPVIARATSLHWVNWGFFCIYGRYDFARRKGFRGLGVDFRRKLHKLEIASDFAQGASGVEIAASPFVADADALTGIAEGIQFGADFEDLLSVRTRLDARSFRLYDCTSGPSPYREKMKRGYLSNYFLMATDRYGALQCIAHGENDWRLFTLFNWDYEQAKILRLVPEDLPEGDGYFLNVGIDNRKNASGRSYSAPELRRGIMIAVPAGGIAGVLIARKRIFPEGRIDFPAHAQGREIRFRIPDRSGSGMAEFIRKTFNPQMERLARKYPDAGFRRIEVTE